MTQRVLCYSSRCPSTFELIPPSDGYYNIPKEKPTSNDNIKRIYECENGHKNIIYWHKRDELRMSPRKPQGSTRAYSDTY